MNVEQTIGQWIAHNSVVSRSEARALQRYARFIKRFAERAGEHNASLIVQTFKYFDSQKFGVDQYRGALWQLKPGIHFFPLEDDGTSEYILHVKGEGLYLGIFLRDEQGRTTVQLADLPLETASSFDTQRQSFWNTIASQKRNPLQLVLSE
jgi:hypothetical protein